MGDNNVTKLSNKELVESAFRQIEDDIGFHIIDVEFMNSYSVFGGEDNSICQFHIKEIPHFLFAFWSVNRFDTLEYQKEHNIVLWSDSLDVSSKSELIFFTQYERDIDKFKPSRSGFVTGIFRESYLKGETTETASRVEEWNNYELNNILNYMHKHPIKAAEYSGCQTRYIWDDDRSGFKIFRIWLKDWYYHYKYKLKGYIKYKKQIKVAKHIAKKLKCSYSMIIDKGECCNPRIGIYFRRKPEANIKEYLQELDIMEKFDSKYWNDIDIVQFDIDLTETNISEKDWEEDKQLLISYKELVSYYKEKTDDGDNSKIIYDNMEEV
jgi:hypothetical protein